MSWGIPMRRLSRLAAPILLAWAALAAAPAMADGAPPIRLVAPRAGATLAAGSTAELEWTPDARLAGVEEWEAFLSLDGGATYPVRITPHLDQDLRRVRWQVPPIPTPDARLLLRFGDERREVFLALPQRFAIVASPMASPAIDRTLLFSSPFVKTAPARGEPALPGRSGVVAWVEGSRRGGSLRQVVAAELPGLRARLQPIEPGGEATVLAGAPSPLSVPEPRESPDLLPPGRGAPLAGPGGAPLLAFDILLLTQRRNE
jgi:hypothetical protein